MPLFFAVSTFRAILLTLLQATESTHSLEYYLFFCSLGMILALAYYTVSSTLETNAILQRGK